MPDNGELKNYRDATWEWRQSINEKIDSFREEMRDEIKEMKLSTLELQRAMSERTGAERALNQARAVVYTVFGATAGWFLNHFWGGPR